VLSRQTFISLSHCSFLGFLSLSAYRVMHFGYGPSGLYKEGKRELSLRAAFPFQKTTGSNNSIQQVMALLVVALIYISVSSYVSVMPQRQVGDSKVGGDGVPVPALAMLQAVSSSNALKVIAAASESDRELAEEEKLRQRYFASFLEDMSNSDDGILKAAAASLDSKAKRGACNVQEAKEADPWNPHDGVRRDIGMCMQIRNDAGIIDEHIAFHWVQGVSKFVIYDDGSEDNPWLVLEKYVALGIVEYHDMTGHWQATSVTLQLSNMNECLTALRARAAEKGLRWVIFPDLDEFVLSSIPGETLSDTLNAKYKGDACLQISRTWYGSSFRHQKPTGLVAETYLLASSDHADGFPKLIANIYPDNRTRNATQLHSIHDFQDQGEIPCILKNHIKDVRINHYLRSLEEYDKKSLFGPSQDEKYTQPLKKFFARDHNTHLSLVASAYSCQVHTLLQQMQEMQTEGKIPTVVRPRAWNETHI